MSRKGENIYRRKDGRYEARYVSERDYDNKILKYGYVYGKNYKEVKIKRDMALENVREKRGKARVLGQKAFAHEIKIWLNNKLNIKDSTFYNYYSIVYSRLVPYFGNTRLRNIDENDVLKYTKSLQQEGLSSKRIKDILIVLKQFFKSQKIVMEFEYPKTVKNNIVSIKEDELAMLEEKTLNSDDIKIFSIWFVLFTGLRIGELCALQWKDFDFENQVIYVSKTLVRIKNPEISYKKTKVIVDTPKTETSMRVVPIHNQLLPYIMKFKGNENDFILTGTRSFMPTNVYYHFYRNFLDTLDIKRYNFHVLRHTFATRSLLNGIDIKTLSEILGHASVKITLDRYVHINNGEKLNQINRLPFGITK